MKRITLFLAGLCMSGTITAADIFMVGDSTMCPYSEDRAPLTGWGVKLAGLTASGVRVHNHAGGGLSSKSYMTSKRWEELLKSAKKGDYVIIQFGHNDGVLRPNNFYRFTDAEKTYPLYLKIYIEESRLRGLIPVLLSQTVYCGFRPDGSVYNFKEPGEVGGAPYVAACRKVAEETGCDFLDINGAAMEKFASMSKKDIEKLYMVLKPGDSPNYPKGRVDHVHLTREGAAFYAELFVKLAKEKNLGIAKLFK